MGGLMRPLTDIETIEARNFLAEATGLHIEGLAVRIRSSGVTLEVGYKDRRGHSHHKKLTNPDARDFGQIEDMIVMASEWLAHGTTDKLDSQKVTIN